MTQALASLDGATPEEFGAVARAIQSYIKTEDDNVLLTVAEKIDERPGLRARFFPTELEQEERRLTVDKLRSIAASREGMYKLYTDVRLDVARRQADALVQSVGVGLQGQLASVVLTEMDRITLIIGRSRSHFMAAIAEQEDEIGKYQDRPTLHQAALKALQNQQDKYFATLEELLEGFLSMLKSRITSPAR
jgi:hypothetical protein